MSGKNETVQQKIDRLNEILAWFESQDFSVEEAIDKFKTADKIAKEVEVDLKALKNEVSVIKKQFDK